jgi:2-amino-4-hydroxy-6-hydroxymethyldihydropteridine diphosphokinase
VAIYIGLGSNLGDRLTNLRRAVELLRQHGVTTLECSSVYESSPVEMRSVRPFYNAVIRVESRQSPEALLHTLHEVESELGRLRAARPGAGECHDRTCDLDLLLYEDIRRFTSELELPHPRIGQRRFVLLPLLELSPQLRDPLTGQLYASDSVRLASDTIQHCERRLSADQWAGSH